MRTPAAGDTPTNEMVIDAAHPANMGLDNLVFQHLRFDHCEEDFAALLDPHSRNEAPLDGYLYDDQSGPSAPWGVNAQDGHKQNWGRPAKPTARRRPGAATPRTATRRPGAARPSPTTRTPSRGR